MKGNNREKALFTYIKSKIRLVDRIRTLVIPGFLKNGVSTNIDVVSSKVQKVMDDETLATLDTNLLFGRFRPALELEKYI